MNGVFNNTPIIYGFNGFSVYSSILNRNLLSFYWNDLRIDMGRESVSRYATLGNRANLYSLLYGKYYMTEKTNEAGVPYGFKKSWNQPIMRFIKINICFRSYGQPIAYITRAA